MSRATTSALQMAILVAVCALLGYSLSRFPGSESVAPWVPTTIGAVIGAAAFLIAPLFSRMTHKEQQASDHDTRLRQSYVLGAIGGALCVCGFLLAVLLAPKLGTGVFLVGWVVGVAAWVLFRQAKHAA